MVLLKGASAEALKILTANAFSNDLLVSFPIVFGEITDGVKGEVWCSNGGSLHQESRGYIDLRKSSAVRPGVPETPGEPNRGLPAGVPRFLDVCSRRSNREGPLCRDTRPSRASSKSLCEFFLCAFVLLRFEALNAFKLLAVVFLRPASATAPLLKHNLPFRDVGCDSD